MNVTPPEIASLLVQLAQATPDIEAIVQHPDEPRWAIAWDGDIVVTAELVADRGLLCLCADLGHPHEQHRAAVWEAMLLQASMRAVTGGLSMALADPGGECQILRDVAVDPANPGALQASLTNFVDHARRWRAVVARGTQAQGTLHAAPDMLHAHGRA